ncbi:hypothetical protein [Isobaculum melis]|uniref:Uncharacterized protein n=1 Tax=Isobaculum melis TaxID=142588 RepID=A0A1H9QJ90_9LACT|nr:hypothetical protein [Isobaculum melis]SER60566.1 hypothetical protein SAMN04488559_102118 [Isobaculum melis]
MTLGTRFCQLLQHFDEEKKEYAGHYYRIKKLDQTHYEIACLVPGYCGDFSYHPKMKVELIDNQLLPLSYFDNEVIPTIHKEKIDVDSAWLNKKCLELISKFEEVVIEL